MQNFFQAQCLYRPFHSIHTLNISLNIWKTCVLTCSAARVTNPATVASMLFTIKCEACWTWQVISIIDRSADFGPGIGRIILKLQLLGQCGGGVVGLVWDAGYGGCFLSVGNERKKKKKTEKSSNKKWKRVRWRGGGDAQNLCIQAPPRVTYYFVSLWPPRWPPFFNPFSYGRVQTCRLMKLLLLLLLFCFVAFFSSFKRSFTSISAWSWPPGWPEVSAVLCPQHF